VKLVLNLIGDAKITAMNITLTFNSHCLQTDIIFFSDAAKDDFGGHESGAGEVPKIKFSRKDFRPRTQR